MANGDPTERAPNDAILARADVCAVYLISALDPAHSSISPPSGATWIRSPDNKQIEP